MKLIITETILRTELRPLSDIFSINILKEVARKTIQGLGKSIKSSSKIKGTKLKKLNLTSSGGAGRVVFLLEVSKKYAVLVMLRHKNDKKIGINMSANNPHFKKILNKNLDAVIQDLINNDFQSHQL